MEEISINNDKEINVLFENHLKRKGISYSYVARNLHLDPSHIRHICKGDHTLTENVRKEMNDLLETNF